MSAPTPGQALSPDPADFAYHVRATAFNVLTGKMAGDEWHVPRSERDAIARAVVDAVEPLIRADERAVAAQEPQPASVPAGAMAALTKVVASHERVMYAAAIDIRHGQPGAARRLLGEQLDDWDGPQWDGTETGAQYLKRTREGA